MTPTLPTFVAPVAVLLAMIVLVRLLRWLMRCTRHEPHGPDFIRPYTVVPAHVDADVPTTLADAFFDRWLPLLVGIAIVFGSIWLVAWLGWLANELFHGTTAVAGWPPWFGTPRSFFLFFLVGIFTLFIGGWTVAMSLAVAYAVGTWAMWPGAARGQPSRDGRRRP